MINKLSITRVITTQGLRSVRYSTTTYKPELDIENDTALLTALNAFNSSIWKVEFS